MAFRAARRPLELPYPLARKMTKNRNILILFALMLAVSHAACSESDSTYDYESDDEDIPEPVPDPEDLGPDSLVGYTLRQKITSNDDAPGAPPVDTWVEFHFVDENTVLAEGITIPAETTWHAEREDWEWVTLRLDLGYAEIETLLDFATHNAGMFDTWVTYPDSVSDYAYGGAFSLEPMEELPDEELPACVVNDTGLLTIFTTVGDDGDISVSVDGNYVGTLTHHFGSQHPDCGSPNSGGIITLTVSSGEHTLRASGQSATWSPFVVEVEQCGCSRMGYTH